MSPLTNYTLIPYCTVIVPEGVDYRTVSVQFRHMRGGNVLEDKIQPLSSNMTAFRVMNDVRVGDVITVGTYSDVYTGTGWAHSVPSDWLNVDGYTVFMTITLIVRPPPPPGPSWQDAVTSFLAGLTGGLALFVAPAAAATISAASAITASAAAAAAAASVEAGSIAGAVGAAGAAGAAAETAGAGMITTALGLIGTAITVTLPAALLVAAKSIVTAFVANTVISQFDIGGWILNTMLNPVLGGLERLAPTSPAVAKAGQEGIIHMMSGALNSLIGMTVTAESLSAFKSLGLGYLSAMLFDASGYRVLIGGIVEAYTKNAILIPMGYYTKEKFRPEIPDMRDVLKLRSKRMLDDVQFLQYLGWHGYPDELRSLFEELAIRDPSFFMLNRIASTGGYNAALFETELRRMGYSDPLIAALQAAFARSELTSDMGEVVGALRKHVREGFMTRDQFHTKFGEYRAFTDAEAKQLFLVDLEYDYDYKVDIRALWIDAFVKGKVDRATATSELGKIMPAGERVTALLDRAALKLKIEKKKTVVSAEI